MGSAINYSCSCGLSIEESDTEMLLSGVQRVTASGQRDYCPDCLVPISYKTVDVTFPEGRQAASMEEVSNWHDGLTESEIYKTTYSPCPHCEGEKRESFAQPPICPRCQKPMQISGQIMID